MMLKNTNTDKYQNIPGWELVSVGLINLSEGKSDTIEALLVQMYSPRLMSNNIEVPEIPTSDKAMSYNMKLYRLLESRGEDAHSKFNSLQRRMVSFCSTLEGMNIRNSNIHSS